MKFILTFLISFAAFQLMSQNNSIVFKKSKFFQNEINISMTEASNIFEETSMASFDQFSRAKKLYRYRNIVSGLGITTSIISIVSNDEDLELAMLATSALSFGGALLLHVKGNKKFKNAASIHNQIKAYSTTIEYNIQLSIVQDGQMSLSINF